ncbi:MAG: DUF2207 domain-containing protein [Chitinophagaceae bacterium]|nr:DUF2207 domain-containing protein [Chitinophagaceae bacterium]
MIKRYIVFALVLCVCELHAQPFPSVVDLNDRILKFHSDITVQKDGILQVIETITVYNGMVGNIERGIFRDIPSLYKDTSGFWDERSFRFRNVTKNGVKEPFKKENITRGVRLMIGDKDVRLSEGTYTYRIEYETSRQVIFTPQKDELYWNVNGNGWIFSADTVSCIIHFPERSEIGDYRCYTGPEGSTDSECRSRKLSATEIGFTGTRRFEAYEGLTVAVAIQKGIIQPPSGAGNSAAFLKANYIIPLLSFLLVFFVGYYFYVWYRKGRDPQKGVIYPQFSPPPGIDPAEAGYILTQKYGSHLFAAALIEAAVKRQLNIEVSREGLIFKSNAYTFTKPENIESANGNTGFNLNQLYGQKAVKGKYNSTLRSCYTSLHNDLKDKFLIRGRKKNKDEPMFVLNRGYIIFAMVVVIASVVATIKFITERPSVKIGIFCAIVLAIILITHLVFRSIMSAYTKKGREVVDHLLGFRMYLGTAEQRLYNQLTPPEKTLDLFEKYLPYAVALQVENEWSEKFDSIMATAMASGYQPAYYHFAGHSGQSFSMNDFSRGISSGLASTLSSASTPPSSSSSGGGSSGGGGGGGGGGGW